MDRLLLNFQLDSIMLITTKEEAFFRDTDFPRDRSNSRVIGYVAPVELRTNRFPLTNEGLGCKCQV